MPRLSLWKEGKHTNDYKFFDRRISEMFTVGGTGVNLHKYLGTLDQNTRKTASASATIGDFELSVSNVTDLSVGQYVTGTGLATGTKIGAITDTTLTLTRALTGNVALGNTVMFDSVLDATQPNYTNQSEKNIQDLFFLENRDRKYDTSIYNMRGIYQLTDQDFNLSQFGLFLNANTLFISFHINDMMDRMGRRIMAGDVLELPHLKDYNPLGEEDMPAALKRYYVVQEATRASEGFSPTWFPHIWRCKCTPLVDSQEYQDILQTIKATDDPDSQSLRDLLSTYNKNLQITDAIVAQAETELPNSGYDTTSLYVVPLNSDGSLGNPLGQSLDVNLNSGEVVNYDATTPDKSQPAYLGGDGIPPNGWPATAGVAFPEGPIEGDYCLRLDYMPNRLFRYNGVRWNRVEDNVRTQTGMASNTTLQGSFVNNAGTFTDFNGQERKKSQSLSKALRPEADN